MTGKAKTLTAPDGTQLVRARPEDQAAVEDLQFAAYAANRDVLGLEPVPLLADYVHIMQTHEVWLRYSSNPEEGLLACLILDTNRADDVLIWSISTSPSSQRLGMGHALLACAEQRARELGRSTMRLYTGEALTHLIDWYGRNGYVIERIEQLEDRNLVHMIKQLN